MSAEGIIWAQKLLPLLANDAQRLMVYHFGLRANPDGLLFPSVADIAMELGKSSRAVRRTIKELDSDEVIHIQPDFNPKDGSQSSNYYQCLFTVTPQELLKRRKARSGRPIM